METQKFVFVITKDMHSALKRQARRRGATISGLLRIILSEWLQEQGEQVEWQVEWGGQRPEQDRQRQGI